MFFFGVNFRACIVSQFDGGDKVLVKLIKAILEEGALVTSGLLCQIASLARGKKKLIRGKDDVCKLMRFWECGKYIM